jgi:hypothetical protein
VRTSEGVSRVDLAFAVIFEDLPGERWFAPHLIEPTNPPD